MVGTFHLGRSLDNRPEALASWRVTTGSSPVAAHIGAILGGRPESCPAGIDTDAVEVLTSSARVRVILDGPDAVQFSMRRWGRTGLLHHCDGTRLLSTDDSAGQPCGCPATFEERKARAKAGLGPQPSTTVSFRLAGATHLGVFQFGSRSWHFAKSVPSMRATLGAIPGASIWDLSITRIEHGSRSGAVYTYTAPTLQALDGRSLWLLGLHELDPDPLADVVVPSPGVPPTGRGLVHRDLPHE